MSVTVIDLHWDPQTLPARRPNLWFGNPYARCHALINAVNTCIKTDPHTTYRVGAWFLPHPTATSQTQAVVAFEAMPPVRVMRQTHAGHVWALPVASELAGHLSLVDTYAALANQTLTPYRGQPTALTDLFDAYRSKLPPTVKRGGGAGLALTLESFNWGYVQNLKAPAIQATHALIQRNQLQDTRLYLEWLVGPCPVHHVLHENQVLRPATSVRPLLEWLLGDLPFEADPRTTDPHYQTQPEILLNDAALVVIHKPSGLLSVPGTGGLVDAMTLTSALVNCPLRAIHRLDMDTSGLLIYAKTQAATEALMAQFRHNQVQKDYEALVHGVPLQSEGDIYLPLTMNPLDRLRQCVAWGGRACHTHYQVLEADAHQARLQLHPVTGRTHQLRMHVAHPLGLGTPIQNDPFYGPQGLAAETPQTPLCLHARALRFTHPTTHQKLAFEVPAPF